MRSGRLLLLALLFGCGGAGETPQSATEDLPAARGVILISLDALRADRLGAYGYERDTSPFFDALARRGTLFERAAVQYPATLVSNATLFTGRYPGEHGAYPPSGVIPTALETLPERFRRHGFRTAAHTEGGFMAGGFGFARGFEEYTDTPHTAETDIERTFGRGIEFLERLGPGERFFLFLHTFATHDPYTPPPRYLADLGFQPVPTTAPPTGPTLRAFNRGELELPATDIARFSDLYDASIRYTDNVLRTLFLALERLGLADDTAVVITSDHGEEFGEHGKLGHTQIYPETLFVPLLVVHPELGRGRRVLPLVESVDFGATLLDLAGVEETELGRGRSLLPLMTGAGEPTATRAAYAEVIDRTTARSLIVQEQGALDQLVVTEAAADPEGAWITETVTFDHPEDVLAFEAQSFDAPRTLTVTSAGAERATIELGTTWQPLRVELPAGAGKHRVTLATKGCASPQELGLSDDARCLSFQMRGVDLRRLELYDLLADPGAQTDRSAAEPDRLRQLIRRLRDYRFEPLAEPQQMEVPAEVRETLRALGYVD